MASNILNLNGIEPAKIYETLIEKGVAEQDAGVLVGQWILNTFGATERHFAYSHAVDGNDSCANTFQQQFHHQDWLDGVSVVQANKTPGEDGFNDRLHRIEDDIAALSAEITKAIACTATLRQQVSAALEEIRVELNKLDHDVFQLQELGSKATGPTVGNLSGIKTGSFLGVADFLGDRVTVWKGSNDEYFTLPAMQMFGGVTGVGPTINVAPDLSKFMHSTPDIGMTFNHPFTVSDFVDKYGDNVTDSGQTVKNLVSILPQDATYPSLDAMVEDAAERSAAVIKATDTTDALVATTFTGLGTGITDIKTAPVERLGTVPIEVRTALVAAGIDTVEKLAAVDPTAISAKLTDAGLNVTSGDVAAWKGTALTITALSGSFG